MANRTDTVARQIHGTDPQHLVEKIIRMKVYEHMYWKEHCFALTAETLVDKAIDLKYVGGCYGGNRRPTRFLCLLLKMLQIQPDKEIIREYIRNDDYKYVRLLGAFYLRLTGQAVEIYNYLEPLLNDYRKVCLFVFRASRLCSSYVPLIFFVVAVQWANKPCKLFVTAQRASTERFESDGRELQLISAARARIFAHG